MSERTIHLRFGLPMPGDVAPLCNATDVLGQTVFGVEHVKRVTCVMCLRTALRDSLLDLRDLIDRVAEVDR